MLTGRQSQGFFLTLDLAFFFFATRCFGPLFAAAVTARLNRSQPSGRNSIFASGFFIMDAQAVEQAKGRLQRAERALERLKAAANYDEAEESWSDFLLAAATIYSKLEQGSKSKGTSSGWFGRKKKERKDDPLLRFLHHARNSDEHGIERVAERGGNKTDFLTGESLKFNERRAKRILEVLDGKTGKIRHTNVKVYLYGPSLMMTRVYDRRFGDHCDPPNRAHG